MKTTTNKASETMTFRPVPGRYWASDEDGRFEADGWFVEMVREENEEMIPYSGRQVYRSEAAAERACGSLRAFVKKGGDYRSHEAFSTGPGSI
jgi:hypothetical protein